MGFILLVLSKETHEIRRHKLQRLDFFFFFSFLEIQKKEIKLKQKNHNEHNIQKSLQEEHSKIPHH